MKHLPEVANWRSSFTSGLVILKPKFFWKYKSTVISIVLAYRILVKSCKYKKQKMHY